MAVRIEFHAPQRRKGSRSTPPPTRLILLIATTVFGAHLLFWLTGILE